MASGNPILTKDLPKIAAADLVLSDGLVGSTAGRGTGLVTMEEGLKYLDWKRGYHSNENLLINADFWQPVNRNGQTEYTGVGYTIDGWNIGTNITLNLLENCLKISAGAEHSSNVFAQSITTKANIPHTFSALVKGKGILRLLDKAGKGNSINFDSDDEYVCISVTEPRQMESAQIRIIGGNVAYVKAAKLELGDQQTLAHQDADGNWVLNDPPNYDLQYLLCSQYSPSTGAFVGSQHSNPNLLDNWYLANPINQRGLLEYTAAGYTIDRWKNRNANIICQLQNAHLFLQFASGANRIFEQILAPGVLLPNTQYTMSVLAKNVSGTVRMGINSKIINANSVTSTTALSDSDGNLPGIYIWGNNSSIEIVAIKLELGPVQTLAHKDGDSWVLNDPPPDYGQELAKCQRYYIPEAYGTLLNTSFDGQVQRYFVPLPVAIRTMPKATEITEYISSSSSNNVPITIHETKNVTNIISNGLIVSCQSASAQTRDKNAIYYIKATNLSAEL